MLFILEAQMNQASLELQQQLLAQASASGQLPSAPLDKFGIAAVRPGGTW